jgi:hypothetical protein
MKPPENVLWKGIAVEPQKKEGRSFKEETPP